MDIYSEKMVNNSEIKDFLEIHPKQSNTQEQNQGNKYQNFMIIGFRISA